MNDNEEHRPGSEADKNLRNTWIRFASSKEAVEQDKIEKYSRNEKLREETSVCVEVQRHERAVDREYNGTPNPYMKAQSLAADVSPVRFKNVPVRVDGCHRDAIDPNATRL